MKKFLSLIASLAISASAFTYNFQQGWQLEGALSDMNITQFKNDSIISVWTYDYQNQKWMAYFPNKSIDLSKYGIELLTTIKKGQGFWVNAASNFSINVLDDDQKAYEQGYQDGYNQGYQDTSNNYNNSVSSDESYSDNNSQDNYGNEYNLSAYLVDKPTNFDLNDIAGKTFKIIDDNGSVVNITFDNNGEATVTLSSGTYNAKYENGVINVYKDNNLLMSMQKIKGDENGFVTLETYFDGNDISAEQSLDALLAKINPVDIGTLNYPLTLYGEYGKIVINNDGTIEMPWGEETNYTIQDGKIIVSHSWNDYGDDNVTYGGNDTDAYQIIDQIDRYYVVEDSYTIAQWMISSSFKGKTFDDIIGSNIQLPIEGYVLDKNGSVECPWYADGNFTTCGTYQKISPTEIKIKALEDDPEYNGGEEDYFTETYTIDPDTGKITNIQNWVDTEIYSTSPIIKDYSTTSETSVSTSTTYRKLPMNLKQYIKSKIEKARKRIF